MLAVLLSWIILFFVFISYGEMLLAAYNKLCSRHEEYSLLNIFLLGIPSLLIVLSCLHFIVPINSTILLLLCLSSLIYWILRRSRRLVVGRKITDTITQFSVVEKIVILLFLLTMLFITAWGVLNYDSGCYHYQSLRWIEEYSTVVGLGNIEERIGFNSNYFILSAPFSMRFILAQPLFALQGLLVVLMFIWIASEIVQAKYSFKSVFLLLLHLLVIAINIIHFADSSTDVLPNQLVFYLVAYLVLHPQKSKNSYLFFAVLPVIILTFKLSLAIFALLGLVVLIEVVKQKAYKAFIFILATCFIICSLWLIRNAILSGYLIFPIHEIDLFSFDWKVPKEVALLERSFIYKGALWQFKNLYNNALTLFYTPQWHFIHTYVIAVVYVVLGILGFYVAYLKMKKRVQAKIFILYLIVVISTIAGYLSAPDFRFTYGLVFGGLFISTALFADNVFKNSVVSMKARHFLSAVFVALLLFHLNTTFIGLFTSLKDETIGKIICQPRLYEAKKVTDDKITHHKIKINNNIDLYISNNSSGFTMYKIPAVTDDVTYPIGWRFQHYKNLEARGTSLQDGFRTKKDL